jgi:hypothetical protein
MKRKELGVLLAGVLALGLGACSSTGTSSDTMGSTADTSTSGSASGSTGATGSTESAGSDAMGSSGSTATGSSSASQYGSGTGSMPSASSSAPNSTVTNIEIIPRQSGGAGTGAGTVGGANAAGTTGSSMASDRIYRITLRMDNGTVQVITQEATPSFSTGDRVRMSSGAIER